MLFILEGCVYSHFLFDIKHMQFWAFFSSDTFIEPEHDIEYVIIIIL